MRPSAAPGDALTERGQALYKALEKHGGWMSRMDIARAMGKKRLNPHEIDLLERMVSAQLIKVRERDIPTPIAIAYDYKVIDEG